MRPVIPRVRVGDILKGTRNLRHYLQTAATLNYITDLAHGMMGRKKDKQHLYTPSKDESFLVVVNAWGTFCAISTTTGVGLLFRNPAANQPIRPIAMRGRSLGLYMDPTIFSQWFIRTAEKQPDVRKWPDHAFYIWASIQLNLTNVMDSSALTVHVQGGSLGPFQLDANGKNVKRDHVTTLIQQWSVRGNTRLSAPERGRLPNGGYGPRLVEIEEMKSTIKDLCRNPRVAQRLRSENPINYQAIMGTAS